MQNLHWIETFSGIKFHYLEPKQDDIRLQDIAHALSLICRYNGHTPYLYSVGQHSLNVYELLKQAGYTKRIQLIGLLHDTAEAYITDMPAPIKREVIMLKYRTLENHLLTFIFGKYLPQPITADEYNIVKDADRALTYFEGKFLMHNTDNWTEMCRSVFVDDIEAGEYTVDFNFGGMAPKYIEDKFLCTSEKLIKEVSKCAG